MLCFGEDDVAAQLATARRFDFLSQNAPTVLPQWDGVFISVQGLSPGVFSDARVHSDVSLESADLNGTA